MFLMIMRKLKACFLMIMLTVAAIGTALAQGSTETNEAPEPRQEIGFGTNIILGAVFKSGSSPLDILYRWGDNKKLFRLGTSLAFSAKGSHSIDLSHKNWNNFYSTELFIGREWRKEATERWFINFGADINLNYRLNSRLYESTKVYDGGVRFDTQESRNRSVGGGLRPFIGILFKINDRLLLGTEASLVAVVRRHFDRSQRSYLIDGVQDDRGDNYDNLDARWEFSVRTQPASNIFVYYRF